MTISLPRAGGRWWSNPTVLGLLCLATGLPVLVTSLPPLTDYLSHIGRYHIQTGLADSPLLQRNWDFKWAVIGNLGVDLLIEILAPLFGVERAAWFVALLVPPLMALGFVRTARTLHGEVPATALAALPLTLAYPFQYGFMNYWLGLALVFNLFASWLAWRPEGDAGLRKAALFVPAGLAVWLCHAFAWGVFGVLAGGAEIGRAWQTGQRGARALLIMPALRCWPLLPPMIPMIIWRSRSAPAETFGWFRLDEKVAGFTEVLEDQSIFLDIGSVIAISLLVYFAIRSRHCRFAPPLAVPALVCVGLAILFPFQLLGSAFSDVRLWPVAIAAILLSIRISPKAALTARRIALGALALFAIRIAIGTIGFAVYDRAFASHLQALDSIEPGARVVVLVRWPCDRPWRGERLEHLGSIAIVRRDAFTNTQWADDGAQLLIPLGGRETPFNANPSQLVTSDPCPDDMRPLLDVWFNHIARDRFDYVWVLGFDPDGLPARPGFEPQFSDRNTILYRIERRVNASQAPRASSFGAIAQ